MSVSTAYSPSASPSHVFRIWALAHGLLASWRRYRAEQAMTALPYDMLKDIGFRSANDSGNAIRK